MNCQYERRDLDIDMAESMSLKRGELYQFEVKSFNLDDLVEENCVGRGAYGAAFKVAIDGVPRIAKRVHSVLLSSDDIQQKFYQECILLSKIDHPNIVEFVGVHFNPFDKRDIILIMELLHLPLESFLERDVYMNTALSVKLHILRDVSCGLYHLHTRFDTPLIHRDLTVGNILLTKDLQAKIVDLGVSKLLSNYDPLRQRTLTMCPGNFSYMPPEALQENPKYDSSLDIFSFGHLSLHVESRQYPVAFDVIHSEGMMAAASSGEIEILRRKKWIAMVSHDCLKDVILQCLRDRPEERPSTKKLATTLKTLCAQHPKSIEDVMIALGNQPLTQVAEGKSDSEMKELARKVNELELELAGKESQIQNLRKMLNIDDDQSRENRNIHSKVSLRTIDELQAKIKTLMSENEQKDTVIKKLKQEHRLNEHKNQSGKETNGAKAMSYHKGHSVDLNWSLECKPCGELVVLGSGSYGKVYKGCCKNTGKHLAVKVVLDLTQKAADDLEKEVKQLSGLNAHKRIVTYLGACYADHPRFREKCLYVFTEFMPGGSLSSCLEKRGPFTQVLTRHYTRQILEGVEYLHHCQVIHRDIKGSNIMCDTSGNVKLADFGSAKQICSETLDKDKTKYLCGTAPWAAPEVLRGEKAQTHSDIWSVAATVVEMLTGAMPYKTEKFDNSMAIIFQVGGNKLNPLKSLKRGGHGRLLTDDVETFLSKCFNREGKERPSAKLLLTEFPFCKQ